LQGIHLLPKFVPTKKQKKMARIAIPISDNVLSNQYNQCGYFDIFEIEHKKIISKQRESICQKSVNELNNWILSQEITDIIVHEIDKSSVSYFADTKVNLFIGVNIKSPDQLINEYLEGSLKSNSQYITI
jgi:predicted Fe-Mo cluster-binding NifX family protein